ncbi:SDR family oxidoreductase [Sciscionella sediminilitoris]|uniref:SDR family oxidoreductase n=1 Tax=Sciscionella sediminilitoris TaxID=1445613 RepID=UPI0004DECD30|nr:SDR family oxidoreductase [Sciscionella sp. SE31]
MLDSFSLQGKTAFVTGAGRGIGAAIATGWARAGAAVACFDLDADTASAQAETLRGLGAEAIGIGGDVTDADSVAAAVERTVDELGGLDIALNNAGIAHQAPAEELAPADWRRMIDVNLTGVFLCAQAEARVMLERGGGSIVNLASMSGSIVNRGLTQAHYNSAKAGVMHLTKSLAVEWARRGIRVNSISPGYTLTPMTQRPEVAGARAEWEDQTPMGRMVDMDELVGPAIFLASQASSACTGLDLIADCGFVCW